MKTVQDVLDSKGHDFFSITPDTPAQAAAKQMHDHGVGALLVMDASKALGLVTERDLVQRLLADNRSLAQTQVRDIMSTRVVCVRPEQTMNDCMALMTEKRVRHLPVLEGDKVIGIVSIGDAVKSVIEDQQFLIEQLEHYIAG